MGGGGGHHGRAVGLRVDIGRGRAICKDVVLERGILVVVVVVVEVGNGGRVWVGNGTWLSRRAELRVDCC